MLDRIRQMIAAFDQQPLFTFEWRRWQNVKPSKGLGRWFNLLIGWSVLLTSIALYLIELIRAALGSDLNIVPYNMRWVMGVYAVLALVFYTTPWRQGQNIAQQIVARDKSRPAGWELIVLTGVDARSYVRAKWWLLMRALAPAILYAGVVRAGAVTFLVAEFTRSMAASAYFFGGNTTVYPPSFWDILLVGILSLVLPYLSLPSAAASYIDNALDARRNGNTWFGSFWRSTLFVVIGAFSILLGLRLISAIVTTLSDTTLALVIVLLLFSAFDNGILLTGQLAGFAYTYRQGIPDGLARFDAPQVLLVALLMLPFSLLIAWFWLKMAEWTAQRYELAAAPSVRRVESGVDAQPHPEPIR